jgi:hypothetical protein
MVIQSTLHRIAENVYPSTLHIALSEEKRYDKVYILTAQKISFDKLRTSGGGYM